MSTILRSLTGKSSLLSGIAGEAYHKDSMAIDAQIEAFLEMLAAERGAAVNTLAAYDADLRDFAAYLGRSGVSVGRAAEADLGAYVASLHAVGLSPRTQTRRLSALKQFFLFLQREGVREDNPVSLIIRPRLKQALPKYLSESEVERLLSCAGRLPGRAGLKASAGLEILYTTGLRVSELLALPARALSGDAALIIIKGKGGRERVVPLSEAAKEAAARLRDASSKPKSPARFLFPGRAPGAAMTRQGFGLLLKQVAIKAGIDPSRLSPHVLRHSFASHLVAHGADLRSLQKLLGHADISTTQIYTHILAARLQRLVQAHHPLAHPPVSQVGATAADDIES
jgi:integrase/recombinase XerD